MGAAGRIRTYIKHKLVLSCFFNTSFSVKLPLHVSSSFTTCSGCGRTPFLVGVFLQLHVPLANVALNLEDQGEAPSAFAGIMFSRRTVAISRCQFASCRDGIRYLLGLTFSTVK